MSPIEVRFRREDVWKGLIAFVCICVGIYSIFDYLPIAYWFGFAGGIIYGLIALDRAYSPEPIIVINDEGVFDRRLRVGVVHWEDIRHIKLKRRSGIYFVSFELHNKKTYTSRRPLWLKIWSAMFRPFGLSPIAINTVYLDIDRDKLIAKLHEGCTSAALRAR